MKNPALSVLTASLLAAAALAAGCERRQPEVPMPAPGNMSPSPSTTPSPSTNPMPGTTPGTGMGSGSGSGGTTMPEPMPPASAASQ